MFRRISSNVFEAVKQSVTTRQAAERYGVRVGRNGMCRCPFLDDKTPSMKADRRFHCFGCGADGDAIDFVSRLEAVSPKEAALMLAQAFSVPYETRSCPATGNHRRKPRNKVLSVWSGIVSGYCATTETCFAAGRRTVPPRPQRTIGTLCLWKPCKSRTMWTICWTRCSPRTWRNGRR